MTPDELAAALDQARNEGRTEARNEIAARVAQQLVRTEFHTAGQRHGYDVEPLLEVLNFPRFHDQDGIPDATEINAYVARLATPANPPPARRTIWPTRTRQQAH